MTWRKPKKLEEFLKLEHGTLLFIEEGDPKEKMEVFNWYKEFQKEQDKVVLIVNDPHSDPEGTVFTHRLEMSK